jgi:hypothetical protein
MRVRPIDEVIEDMVSLVRQGAPHVFIVDSVF